MCMQEARTLHGQARAPGAAQVRYALFTCRRSLYICICDVILFEYILCYCIILYNPIFIYTLPRLRIKKPTPPPPPPACNQKPPTGIRNRLTQMEASYQEPPIWSLLLTPNSLYISF